MSEVLLGALLWDALIGYPDGLYRRLGHPVSWMGRLITVSERFLIRPGQAPLTARLMGVLVLTCLAALSGFVAWLAQEFLRDRSFLYGIGWIGEILLVAAFLAGRSLYSHVRSVAVALRRGGLAEGRTAVSRLVGREVSRLDESGVCRASIESLAENFADGVVGPILAFAVLGLPGLATYKAVSTADSMIGHRTERYLNFGWASARADDVLNWVPARISSVLIALASGRGFFRALGAAWRDAGKHLSPNAGWPEAAMAGALGLPLGGPRRYGDLVVDGAWLGSRRDRSTGDRTRCENRSKRGRFRCENGPERGGFRCEAAKPEDIDRALRLYLRAMLLIASVLALRVFVLRFR